MRLVPGLNLNCGGASSAVNCNTATSGILNVGQIGQGSVAGNKNRPPSLLACGAGSSAKPGCNRSVNRCSGFTSGKSSRSLTGRAGVVNCASAGRRYPASSPRSFWRAVRSAAMRAVSSDETVGPPRRQPIAVAIPAEAVTKKLRRCSMMVFNGCRVRSIL
jgi:hypothetical protein